MSRLHSMDITCYLFMTCYSTDLTAVYTCTFQSSNIVSALLEFSKLVCDVCCKYAHESNFKTNKSLQTTALIQILEHKIKFLRQT